MAGSTFRTLAIAFGLMLLATLATRATPPRYVSIKDTPIAANATHLFLLRTVSDNKGSHYINATHRFLIAQSLKTNKVEDHWLLGTTRLDTISNEPKDTVELSPGTTGNPFEILRKKQALPIELTPRLKWPDDSQTPVLAKIYSLNKQGIYNKYEEIQVLSVAELEKRIAASLNPTMQIMQSDPGPVDPMQFDADAYSKTLSGCVVQGVGARISSTALVMLFCTDDEFSVDSYKIYLTFADKQ
jgi:hypothetical protein